MSVAWSEIAESTKLDRMPAALRRSARREQRIRRTVWYGDAILWSWNWLGPLAAAWLIGHKSSDRVSGHLSFAICYFVFVVMPAWSRGNTARTVSTFEALRMPSRNALILSRYLRQLPWLLYASGCTIAFAITATQAPPPVLVAVGVTPFWLFLSTSLRSDYGHPLVHALESLAGLLVNGWLLFTWIAFRTGHATFGLETLETLGPIGLATSCGLTALATFGRSAYRSRQDEPRARPAASRSRGTTTPTRIKPRYRDPWERGYLVWWLTTKATLRKLPGAILPLGLLFCVLSMLANVAFGALATRIANGGEVGFGAILFGLMLWDPFDQKPSTDRWLRGEDYRLQFRHRVLSFLAHAIPMRAAGVALGLGLSSVTSAHVAAAGLVLAIAVLIAGWRGLFLTHPALAVIFGAGSALVFGLAYFTEIADGLPTTACWFLSPILAIAGVAGCARVLFAQSDEPFAIYVRRLEEDDHGQRA